VTSEPRVTDSDANINRNRGLTDIGKLRERSAKIEIDKKTSNAFRKTSDASC